MLFPSDAVLYNAGIVLVAYSRMTLTVIWSNGLESTNSNCVLAVIFSTPYQRAVDMGAVALNGFFVPMLMA